VNNVFRYLGKNMSRQCEFVSLFPFSFYIYIVYHGCVLYLLSLVDRFGT
jgi:hypothetical protein